MKKFFKTIKVKPLDFVLIVLLFVASFSPFVLFASNVQAGTVATLKHDGKVVRTFQLSQDTNFKYDNQGNICNIEVRAGKIAVVSANCATQICVETGWTNSPNKPIICLPMGNTITVNGPKQPQKEDGKVVDYNG
jgi:hypothetical protein